jgi:hypothetical protein
MPLPRPPSPRAALADLAAFLRQRSRHQWIAAVLAGVLPVLIIIAFVLDSETNLEPGPQLIYAESWSANRTDEEIKADQKEDQAKREAYARERQRQFQKVGRSLGME